MPAAMVCRTEAISTPERASVCQTPGKAASARLIAWAAAALTYSVAESSGTPSTERTDVQCSTWLAGATSSRAATLLVAASQANPMTSRCTMAPVSAMADPAWRNVPSASRWWNEPLLTNQPEPWRLSTQTLVPQ